MGKLGAPGLPFSVHLGEVDFRISGVVDLPMALPVFFDVRETINLAPTEIDLQEPFFGGVIKKHGIFDIGWDGNADVNLTTILLPLSNGMYRARTSGTISGTLEPFVQTNGGSTPGFQFNPTAFSSCFFKIPVDSGVGYLSPDDIDLVSEIDVDVVGERPY